MKTGNLSQSLLSIQLCDFCGAGTRYCRCTVDILRKDFRKLQKENAELKEENKELKDALSEHEPFTMAYLRKSP